MAEDGIPYTGFLYAGVMIDGDGNPRALEFNCRLGDPETQPIMMRLKTDFVDLVEHAVDGTLDRIEADWDRRAALGVVLAAAGYPDAPRKGDADFGTRRGFGQLQGVSRGDRAGWRSRRDRGWPHPSASPRSVENGPSGAARRVRRRGRHTLRRHAVSQRHRPSRARAAQELSGEPHRPSARSTWT